MATGGVDDEAIVVMAEIAAAYGVHGWVKVKPFTAQSDALLGYRTWWLQSRRGTDWQRVTIRDARGHSGGLIAQLGGVDARESAMQLAGARIGVPRSVLPSPAKGEIYQSDLVGLDVVNRAGVRLGRVTAVEDFGAHPVLRVAPEGAGGERLIPFVPAHVDGVDLASRRVDVDWEADY